MIDLRSGRLQARLDPAHGGEIVALDDQETGDQLLGRPPFAAAHPRGGELDEATWTASYRGGWQIVLPNAGNACDLAGEHHGFHGAASVDPWSVEELSADAVTLSWLGHGLAARRRVSLDGAALAVELQVEATAARAPLAVVEHFTVGRALLDPAVELELPTGVCYELSETEGPPLAPPDAPRWPDCLRLDGSVERLGRHELTDARSRYVVLRDLPDGRAALRNTGSGQGIELRWDVAALPHLWLWHEVRTTWGAWMGATEILAIEPASVPHGLGLTEADRHGQAVWLEAGDPFVSRLTVTITP